MSERRNWNWDETLVAFRLYCATPFGKLHQHNPDIIALAAKLGRTPSAVGMKACNFASLDPVQRARGISGLPNRGQLEEKLWEQFTADSEAIAGDAEEAYERLLAEPRPGLPLMPRVPTGPTDVELTIRVRRVQRFFRAAVLTTYDAKCALTGCNVTEMLSASHIIPWSTSPSRRADPSNGICLNALHDRAFDRGLITFDSDFRMLLSPAIHSPAAVAELTPMFVMYEGRQLSIPARFQPDREALAYHRTTVFRSS